jgi:hypothetical protein
MLGALSPLLAMSAIICSRAPGLGIEPKKEDTLQSGPSSLPSARSPFPSRGETESEKVLTAVGLFDKLETAPKSGAAGQTWAPGREQSR